MSGNALDPAHDSDEFPQGTELEDLVQLAAEICDMPISAICKIKGDRLHVLASIGTEITEVSLKESFCNHAILGNGLFVVEDAAADVRFKDTLAYAASNGIRFYAGIPLKSSSGKACGTLCVVDLVPRTLTPSQSKALAILGRQVQDGILLRNKNRRLHLAIAENAEMSKKLRNTRDLLSAFLNNGPFISYIKDAEGRFVFYNEQLADRFGIECDEWIGLTDHDLFSKEHADLFRAHDLEVLTEERVLEIHEVTPHAGGGTTPWRSYKFPFKTDDGNQMLAGVSVDITKEVERQDALEKTLTELTQAVKRYEASQFVLQIFMNNIPSHAYLKAEDGRYLFYNRSFADHFGINQEEWLGKRDDEIFPKSVANQLRGEDLRLLMNGEAPETIEHHVGADGQPVAFRQLRFTYRDAEGQPVIAGLLIDVTERIRQHEHFKPGSATEADPLFVLGSVIY